MAGKGTIDVTLFDLVEAFRKALEVAKKKKSGRNPLGPSRLQQAKKSSKSRVPKDQRLPSRLVQPL